MLFSEFCLSYSISVLFLLYVYLYKKGEEFHFLTGVYRLLPWCVHHSTRIKSIVSVGWGTSLVLRLLRWQVPGSGASGKLIRIYLTAEPEYTWYLQQHMPDSLTRIYLTYSPELTWHFHQNIPDIFTRIYLTSSTAYTWQLNQNIPDIFTRIDLTFLPE